MIAALRGRVLERGNGRIVLDVNGVGYLLAATSSAVRLAVPDGEPVTLVTHLHVRDDALVLFGFATSAERDLFGILVGVGGVGPKMAMAVLSVLSPDALRRAVLDGDVDAVTVVPGVGKKLAARIVLDLKDRLGGVIELPGAGPLAEVREALAGMGLQPHEVQAALDGLEPDGEPVEELLRAALSRVGTPAGNGARR